MSNTPARYNNHSKAERLTDYPMFETPYKSPINTYYTVQLFHEIQSEMLIEKRRGESPFTMYKIIPGKISFGRRYIELRDPTGVALCNEVGMEYPHWLALNQLTWFKKHKDMWDVEMDARIKSDAIKTLTDISETGNPAQALVAAKYLAEGGYKKEHAEKGRPKRSRIDGEAKRLAENERLLEEDLKRVMGE